MPGAVTAAKTAETRVVGRIRRHPLVTFLLIFNTFGQTVAFVRVVARRFYGVDLDVDVILIVPTVLFLLLPALVITRVVGGRDGLSTLLRSMLRFRVPLWWYLLPLVVVPGLTLAATSPSALTGLTPKGLLTAYVTAYLPALLFQFATTNWWEESVWTGFFQAPLQERFGPWRAVLITTPFFLLEHLSVAFAGTFGEGMTQLRLLAVAIVGFEHWPGPSTTAPAASHWSAWYTRRPTPQRWASRPSCTAATATGARPFSSWAWRP